jgi:hypothetical protein
LAEPFVQPSFGVGDAFGGCLPLGGQRQLDRAPVARTRGALGQAPVGTPG